MAEKPKYEKPVLVDLTAKLPVADAASCQTGHSAGTCSGGLLPSGGCSSGSQPGSGACKGGLLPGGGCNTGVFV
jgi:hypothetical protein